MEFVTEEETHAKMIHTVGKENVALMAAKGIVSDLVSGHDSFSFLESLLSKCLIFLVLKHFF